MLDIWGVVSVFVKFSLYISVLMAAGTALVVPVFRLKHVTVKVTVILVAFFASFTLYGIDAIALTGDLSWLTDSVAIAISPFAGSINMD